MKKRGIGEADTMAEAMEFALVNLKTKRIRLGTNQLRVNMFYNSKIKLNDVSIALKLLKRFSKKVNYADIIFKGRKDRQAKVVLSLGGEICL